MKAFKWIVVVFVIYVGIVAAFESLIGVFQPANEGTLVLTTYEPDGTAHDRVLSRVEADGKLYVSVNHWPRAWYSRAIKNPNVRVEIDGAAADYVAVPVEGEEFERVAAEHPLPLPIRFLMGFPPPREILRLDATP